LQNATRSCNQGIADDHPTQFSSFAKPSYHTKVAPVREQASVSPVQLFDFGFTARGHL
jgi:hypothetical protein